jgi:hypothetical protein
MLDRQDEQVRGCLTLEIARLGHAPSLAHLAEACGKSVGETESALHRLHAAHALLLHPGKAVPWVVHPFALSPGGCWVETPGHGYWANCVYCAFGIAAALRCDAVITTRYGGEAETAQFRIAAGRIVESEAVFHLSTPVRDWWGNVIHACASFQPFKRESEIDSWCERHALPRGAVMTLPFLWTFARDWYGDYLKAPWRKRTPTEVRELFIRHALIGEFWKI